MDDAPPRSTWTRLRDDELLAQCDVDTYRASGPGGQKRNKTSSAVRLRHAASGLIVIAEESRSQHENKAKALKRLRRTFFLERRETPTRSDLQAVQDESGRLRIVSVKNDGFWPAAGALLDALLEAQGQVSTVAESLGTTTANVVQFLMIEDHVWQVANQIRAQAKLKPLRQ
jgi:hypothetical protein